MTHTTMLSYRIEAKVHVFLDTLSSNDTAYNIRSVSSPSGSKTPFDDCLKVQLLIASCDNISAEGCSNSYTDIISTAINTPTITKAVLKTAGELKEKALLLATSAFGKGVKGSVSSSCHYGDGKELRSSEEITPSPIPDGYTLTFCGGCPIGTDEPLLPMVKELLLEATRECQFQGDGSEANKTIVTEVIFELRRRPDAMLVSNYHLSTNHGSRVLYSRSAAGGVVVKPGILKRSRSPIKEEENSIDSRVLPPSLKSESTTGTAQGTPQSTHTHIPASDLKAVIHRACEELRWRNRISSMYNNHNNANNILTLFSNKSNITNGNSTALPAMSDILSSDADKDNNKERTKIDVSKNTVNTSTSAPPQPSPILLLTDLLKKNPTKIAANIWKYSRQYYKRSVDVSINRKRNWKLGCRFMGSNGNQQQGVKRYNSGVSSSTILPSFPSSAPYYIDTSSVLGFLGVTAKCSFESSMVAAQRECNQSNDRIDGNDIEDETNFSTSTHPSNDNDRSITLLPSRSHTECPPHQYDSTLPYITNSIIYRVPTAVFPIIVGNIAQWHPEAHEKENHSWTVYVRGFNNAPIDGIIESVTFILHPSFSVHTEEVKEPPFQVSRVGWGEFDVVLYIKLRGAILAGTAALTSPSSSPTTKLEIPNLTNNHAGNTSQSDAIPAYPSSGAVPSPTAQTDNCNKSQGAQLGFSASQTSNTRVSSQYVYVMTIHPLRFSHRNSLLTHSIMSSTASSHADNNILRHTNKRSGSGISIGLRRAAAQDPERIHYLCSMTPTTVLDTGNGAGRSSSPASLSLTSTQSLINSITYIHNNHCIPPLGLPYCGPVGYAPFAQIKDFPCIHELRDEIVILNPDEDIVRRCNEYISNVKKRGNYETKDTTGNAKGSVSDELWEQIRRYSPLLHPEPIGAGTTGPTSVDGNDSSTVEPRRGVMKGVGGNKGSNHYKHRLKAALIQKEEAYKIPVASTEDEVELYRSASSFDAAVIQSIVTSLRRAEDEAVSANRIREAHELTSTQTHMT